MEKIKRKLCKKFGHKWQYAVVRRVVGETPGIDIRVCSRCGLVQAWTYYETPLVNSSTYLWANAIQYTDFGAKSYVKGYGK